MTADELEAKVLLMGKLKPAAEVVQSKRLGGLLTEARLLELAEAGYVPSWRFDGGQRLFLLDEVVYTVAQSLLERQGLLREFPRHLTVLAPADTRLPSELPECLEPLRRQLAEVPGEYFPTAVYFLIKKSTVIYVGQSTALMARIGQHRQDKDFDRVVYLPVPVSDLDAVEGAFIRELRPVLNAGAPKDNGRDAEVLSRFGVVKSTS